MRSRLLLKALVLTATACASPTDPQDRPSPVEPSGGTTARPDDQVHIVVTPGPATSAAEVADQQRLTLHPTNPDAGRLDAQRMRDLAARQGDAPQQSPSLQGAPLVRTDFSQDGQWRHLLEVLRTPGAGGELADVVLVDEPRWAGASAVDVLARFPTADLVVMADSSTFATADLLLQVVAVSAGWHLQQMRVAASALWVVANNLSLANMDWEEVEASLDSDGVFRLQ